jgi:hypothetical protein
MTVLPRNFPYRHSIVTVIVTEKTARASGFLADVTVVTIMTVFCKGILGVLFVHFGGLVPLSLA